jgi:response regulator RpfG family c-di-GMP phosphodiesterase
MKTSKRILICDGDKLRAHSLARAITDNETGWMVGVVNRGKDGLNILKEIKQDCILLQETGLSDWGGIRVFRKIRKLDQKVPVIVLSKKPQVENTLEAIHLGVYDYLKEPYSITDVLEVVTGALGESEPYHEKEKLEPTYKEKPQAPLPKEKKVNPKINEPSNGKEKVWRDLPFVQSPDSDPLLSKCLNLSMNLLKADRGVALLVDRESNRLVVKESTGFNGHFLRNSSFDLKSFKDFETIVTRGKTSLVPLDDGVLACTPLGKPPKVYGVIGLGRHEPFSTDDLKILSVLAPLAPRALEGARAQTELEAVRAGSIHSLLVLLEAKDPDYRKHAIQVMKHSIALAKSIELSESGVQSIKFASLLHNVGNIVEVNSKTEDPSSDQMMNGFLELTDRIIEALRLPEDVKHILHHRSERYDGSGEPDRLQGEEIPIGSRILAITDAFDKGLASGRNKEDVVIGLTSLAGSHFDPSLVDHFILSVTLEKNKSTLDLESET